jgi:uncharacterized repeat protein (TIGR01451 family)
MKINRKIAVMLVVALVANLFGITVTGGTALANPKSMYVIADINASPTPIQAYDIAPAPTYLTFQATNTVPRHGGGGVGLAIDSDSGYLFVTYEVSNIIELIDGTTMTSAGTVTAPGATNLAGIVVDEDIAKVYTIDRGTNKLYVYSWNSGVPSLTLDGMQLLPGVSQAHGIALDYVNDKLYVGDQTTTVKIFNTSGWTSAGSFTVSQDAMGIAIDVANQLVYTGNAYPPYGSLGLLSKYDLNTNTETTLNIGSVTGVSGDNVVGLAVDQDSGLLYITTGDQGVGGSDRLMVFGSALNMLYTTGDIGNPTGIAIPIGEIGYNPLNLTKVDNIATSVLPGGNIEYTICYDNTASTSPVTGVTIVDQLPPEVTYVSDDAGGSHVAGTVTWNIGGLPAGDPGACIKLIVQVKPGTPPGTIDNACTISANEAGTGPTTVHEYTDVALPTNGEIEVGGSVYPINQIALLAPWIALAIAIMAGATLVVRRRRARC